MPEPIARRHDLPTAPFRRADIPDDALYAVGVLVWGTLPGGHSPGRPFVSLAVWCERCRLTHMYPWRYDYGLDVDAVLPVVPQCRRPQRRSLWVGLSPSKAEHNARVHAEAHEAYLAWLPIAKDLRAAHKAARVAAAGDEPFIPPSPPLQR